MASIGETGPLLDRLGDKFTVGDDCWQWTGYLSKWGYGALRVGGRKGRMLKAHRVMYELLVGPIPDGLHIDHLCRNRSCVRPDHLEPVTQAENNRRGISGQVNGDRLRARTHCKRGHEFTEENTYIGKTRLGNQSRVCRACHAAHARERRRQWQA